MPNKVSLYASVGPELTHYDVDVDAARADPPRHGQPAGERAVCLAACVAAVPVRRDQRQRVRHGAGRQHASRDRAAHRSCHAARCRRTVRRSALPTRPIHMATDIPSQLHPGRVQQSQRDPRLSDQRRWRRRAPRWRSPGRSMPASSPIRCARRRTTARSSWSPAATTRPTASRKSPAR